MTTNKFDKGLFDTIREHNSIEIYGEVETRAAMADMKQRLEYDDRMAAWKKQKRVTWIPLAILAVALLSQMSNTGGHGQMGVPTAIIASIVMAINFLFAWKWIYTMFSRSTGVPPIFWNLATFSAIPLEKLEPAEEGLTQMSHHVKYDLIKYAAISMIGGLVSWFVSFTHSAPLFFLVGGFTWGLMYLYMMIKYLEVMGNGPFFFPEANARRVDRMIEAAWRRDPTNPTVSRRSLAGKIVLGVRGWQYKRQGKGGAGGTQVRTA